MNIWNWLFHRHTREKDLEEEVQAHLRMAAQERITQGETAEQARLSAVRAFGNADLVKEVTRDMWGLRWLEALLQDLRYGLRQLRRSPGFAAVTILTLALGIGATTGIFSLVEAVLLRPLPGRAPGRLVTIFTSGPDGVGYSSTSYPDYEYWRDRAQSFSSVLAYARIRISWTTGGEPEEAWSELVSGNYFKVLGVKPLLGRAFLPDEDSPGALPAVVVSYNFWRERLNSNPHAAGAALTLNDHPFTVIGVAPEGFEGINAQWGAPPDFWLPMSMQAGAMPTAPPDLLHQREARWLLVIGRLKPRATLAQAKAEAGVLARQLAEAFPAADHGRTVVLLPGSEGRFWPGFREEVIRFLSLLAVAVGLVFLIACSNAANLLLARGAARQKEMSVRFALGASRWRVIRQALTENLLGALVAAAAGLLVALLIMGWLPLFRPFRIPMAVHLTLDSRVFGFAAAASLLTLLLSGIAPALAISKVDLNGSLKEGAHHASAGRAKWRFRQGLIISEVALTTVALIGAGLLLLSLRQLQKVDPGFDPRHVLAVGLDLSGRKYSASDGVQFDRELTQRLATQPGILSATLADDLPLSLLRGYAHVTIHGEEGKAPREGFEIQTNRVAPAYFQTLKIPLLEGREFMARDDSSATPVVIINHTMARRFWPGQNPVGRTIQFLPGNVEREVIGVAEDIKYHALWDAPVSYLYFPMYQSYGPGPTLLVRTAASPLSEMGTVRREVGTLDKLIPIVDVTTLEQQAMDSASQPRAAAFLVGAFGLLALMLSSAGIYGMLAYWVAGRTHEIGIRMALGARRVDVLKQVVGQGLKMTLIGIGVGLAGALALSRFLASLLYGLRPTDAATYAAAAALLAGVAVLASYIPARRATKVDPMMGLRYE